VKVIVSLITYEGMSREVSIDADDLRKLIEHGGEVHLMVDPADALSPVIKLRCE